MYGSFGHDIRGRIYLNLSAKVNVKRNDVEAHSTGPSDAP